ncbi:MAG: hypothetical protein U0324_12435 [Polyangiales bacterium]
MRAHTPYALALLTALAVFHPALLAPRYDDDFTQRAWLRGDLPSRRAPWDLYRWIAPDDFAASRAAGHVPWWAPPAARTGVLRPLASLSVALDHWLLGGGPLAAHLHSFAWLALLAWAAWRFYRAALGDDGAARVALLALVTSTPLAVDLGWLCNRCALMACAFALLSLDRLAAWQRGGARPHLLAALALWSLALASGEYAFAALPLAAVVAQGSHSAAWRRGAGPLALAALSIAWYALAHALGYGGAAPSAALDPAADPWAFATRAPARATHLVLAWLASRVSWWVPLDALAALGFAVAAVAAVSTLRSPRRDALAAWSLAFAGSCVVLSAALLQVRVLLPAMVPFAGGLGLLWAHARGASKPARVVVGAALAALVAQQAVASWRLSHELLAAESARDRELQASARRLAATGASRFLVATARDPEVALNPARVWAAPAPSSWITAGFVEGPVVVLRPTAREVVVRSLAGAALLPAPVRWGARIGDVTVAPEGFVNGAATAVRVTFPGDPGALGWRLVQARGARLEPLPWPPVHAGRVTQ